MNADNTIDHNCKFLKLASQIKDPRIGRKIPRYEYRNIEIPRIWKKIPRYECNIKTLTYGTSPDTVSKILDPTIGETPDDSDATRVFRAAQKAQNA